jgi:phosphoribosyl 1,2-cyclic phosphodiesterase
MKKIKDEFRVKFRGVRGSYPLADSDYLGYGGNTSCVEVHAGEQLIIIDAGTGLISLGNELMQEYLASGTNTLERKPIKATLLLSHIHQDHIQGFTFFRPVHISTTQLNVLGSTSYNEHLADELAQLLFTKSFPLDLGDVAANLNIIDVKETDYMILRGNEIFLKRIDVNEEIVPENEDVIISCYKSYAHPQDGVLIYKISYKNKSLVYATDKESYIGGDKKLTIFARNCDLLIHDAQYTMEDYLNAYSPKQGYGHSTFDMAIDSQKQANAKKLAFFHFDPNYNDSKLDEIEKYYQNITNNAFLAKEGLEIIL